MAESEAAFAGRVLLTRSGRLLADIGSRDPAERPGWVALEIGSDQGAAVAAMVAAAEYPQVEVRRDLAGLDRVAAGSRR